MTTTITTTTDATNVFANLYAMMFGDNHDASVSVSMDDLSAAGVFNIQTYRAAFWKMVDTKKPSSSTLKHLFALACAHQSRRRMLAACDQFSNNGAVTSVKTFITESLCATTSQMDSSKFPAVKLASSFPDICAIMFAASKANCTADHLLSNHWMASVSLATDARAMVRTAHATYWDTTIKLSEEQEKKRKDKNTPSTADIFQQASADNVILSFGGTAYPNATAADVASFVNAVRAKIAGTTTTTATPETPSNPPEIPPPETPPPTRPSTEEQVEAAIAAVAAPDDADLVTAWVSRIERGVDEIAVWNHLRPLIGNTNASFVQVFGLTRRRTNFHLNGEVYNGRDASLVFAQSLIARNAVHTDIAALIDAIPTPTAAGNSS